MGLTRICKCGRTFGYPYEMCFLCSITRNWEKDRPIDNPVPPKNTTITLIEHPLTGQLIPENEFENFNYWFPSVE